MSKAFHSLFLTVAIILSINCQAEGQTFNDSVLKKVTEDDNAARAANNGKLPLLPATDHLYRADVHQSNRHFAEAREHWLIFLKNYPDDIGKARALFGIGRGYMWEREYTKAIEWFDKLQPDHSGTKEGREGLAFKGASHVRIDKHLEAAKIYEQ